MARTIHTKDERAAQFIKAGLKIARKNGIAKTSVAAVAAECDVTAPLIFHNFGSRDAFHKALADAAKKQGVTLPADPAPTRAPRKRSVAEVKAIKDKAAGKRAAAPKKAAKKPAAPKKPAKAPKAVTKSKAPKAVRKARPARAVAAADQPSVSGKFVTMPKPAGLDDNLSPKP